MLGSDIHHLSKAHIFAGVKSKGNDNTMKLSQSHISNAIPNALLILLTIAILLSPSDVTAKSTLDLTVEEQNYLDEKKQLTFVGDPDWFPYERVTSQGKHEGISADYMELFFKPTRDSLHPSANSQLAGKPCHCEVGTNRLDSIY